MLTNARQILTAKRSAERSPQVGAARNGYVSQEAPGLVEWGVEAAVGLVAAELVGPTLAQAAEARPVVVGLEPVGPTEVRGQVAL